MDVPVCFVKNVWVVSNLGLLHIKLLLGKLFQTSANRHLPWRLTQLGVGLGWDLGLCENVQSVTDDGGGMDVLLRE